MNRKHTYKIANNDKVFKEIFLKKGNSDILIPLLEEIVNKKIEILNSDNTEINNRNIKSRRKKLDAILKTNIGIINIESNADYKYKTYVNYRNGSFIAGVYTTYVEKNKKYDGKVKVYQVNLNYNTNKNTKPIIEYYLQSNERNLYVDNLKIISVNMDFYKQMWYSKDRLGIKKYKYIIMLALERKELKNFKKYIKDKVVDKYMSELDAINLAGVNRIITEEEDREFILNTEKDIAREQGLKEGLKEGIIQTARKLLSMNMSIKDISKATNLTIEEINNLKK